MIGIVIVAHGRLAEEYRAAMEHVVGHQDAVRTIVIGNDDDRAAKQDEICDAADAVDSGSGVVVVVDMFGGSPSNLSIKACNPAPYAPGFDPNTRNCPSGPSARARAAAAF